VRRDGSAGATLVPVIMASNVIASIFVKGRERGSREIRAAEISVFFQNRAYFGFPFPKNRPKILDH
jgi:hypothetical protein